MWQKGGGMFCHAIEEVNVDSEFDDDYDHGDDWDTKELVIESEEEDNNNDDMEEDADGYTASERAYMNAINTFEDNDSVEMVEEEEEEKQDHEEEKDERYYIREKKLWKNLQ